MTHERMTDDEVMEMVWKNLPSSIRLEGPNPEPPWAPPVPYPRERIEVPRDAGEYWNYRCPHHEQIVADFGEYARIARPRIVVLAFRRYGVTTGLNRWMVRVYFGQCPDCRRIYWSVVDEEPPAPRPLMDDEEPKPPGRGAAWSDDI